VGLSVFVFTQLFTKAKERSSTPTRRKTEFNVKQPFKVIQGQGVKVFLDLWKTDEGLLA